MKKLKVEVNNEEDLQVLESLLTEMGLKFYVENKTTVEQEVKPTKQETVIDLIEKLEKPNIDPNADFKELYYKDKKHGGY